MSSGGGSGWSSAKLLTAGVGALAAAATFWLRSRSRARARAYAAALQARHNITVPNPVAFARKREHFVRAGHGAVQVMMDFDRTITTFNAAAKTTDADGKEVHAMVRGQCSYSILETSGVLPAEYTAQNDVLFRKYYPIEIDHSLPFAFKCEQMHEWWSKANALQVEFGVHRHHLPRSVAHCLACTNPRSAMQVRGRVRPLFALLRDSAPLPVPLLVFSAGVGDIVAETLRQTELLHAQNTHVLANQMVFDPHTGRLTGFDPRIIHALSKCYAAVAGTAFARTADHRRRRNVLIVGDALHDADMCRGAAPHQFDELLKVGLLDERMARSSPEAVAEYCRAFDVVLRGDPPLAFVENLMRQIVAGRVDDALDTDPNHPQYAAYSATPDAHAVAAGLKRCADEHAAPPTAAATNPAAL